MVPPAARQKIRKAMGRERLRRLMPDIASLERRPGYDVTWPWSSGEPLAPGLTCVFRVRNEARNLPWVLPPIFSAVQHVLLVDNGSDDGTADVARRVAE